MKIQGYAFKEYLKAVIGGLTTALGLLAGFIADGINPVEAVEVVVAFLVGFSGVFFTTNADKPLVERVVEDVGIL